MTAALRLYFRKPSGVIGLLMLLVVIFAAVFAPLIAPYDPYQRVQVQPQDILAPPDENHLLGRDDAGKDVFSQLLYGAQVSLIVGFAASFMAVIIGTTVGLLSGYIGGKLDQFLMRFVDFLLVIPDLPLALVIIAVWGRGLPKIILVIGLLGWTITARLVRSQTLSIKERLYILRARAMGASDLRIIVRHILPQVVPLVISEGVLAISAAILAEASLSFLGLGDPTLISWGNMLNFAFERGMSRQAWWFLLPPGLAILWVSVALILIGRTIEEIVNPRLKSHHLFDARRMVALVLPVPPASLSAPAPAPQKEEEPHASA